MSDENIDPTMYIASKKRYVVMVDDEPDLEDHDGIERRADGWFVMGGMGEQIGSAGNFSVILWCDLTRDVSKFYFSFYENDEFFDPDEKKITSRLIDALRNGEWLDCFGNKSRETDQGFVILDHQEYSISIQVDLCGERASLEVVLIKDGRIVERQDPFDRIESKHYSPFYNVIMERNNLAREMKNEINALTD